MGEPTQQKQTSSSEPPKYAEPYLKEIAGQASRLYNSGTGYQYFPGSTVNKFGQESSGAMGGTLSAAKQGQTGQAAGAGLDYAKGLFKEGGMTPEMAKAYGLFESIGQNNNADFEKSLDYQMSKTADNVNSGFSGMGRYGSGAHAGVLGDTIGGQRATAMSNEFNNLQQQKLAAAGGMAGLGQGAVGNVTSMAGLLPTLSQGRYADLDRQLGVGQMRDGQRDKELQDQINRWNFKQSAPWNALGNYQNIVSGAVGNYGTQTSVKPGPSMMQTLLGGLLGGAGNIAGFM
jgi:hypothetical protein